VKTGRQHRKSIHFLSDNLLLEIFRFCRPVLSDEDGVDNNRTPEGPNWNNYRWWYNIAHVCSRWRNLVLESAPHVGLYHLCTYGTPVAEMLATPPPFPIIIDYGDQSREVTVKDEEGIQVALRRRRRIRHIQLRAPASNLRKLVAALNGEFPMLEYLYIKRTDDENLVLPDEFKAPHLRHFSLTNITYSPDMFHVSPPTSPARSADGARRYEELSWSQIGRYAPLSNYVYEFVSERGPRMTDHCRSLSTSSMTIRFSPYFPSAGRYL
jgi:hypothetical protein